MLFNENEKKKLKYFQVVVDFLNIYFNTFNKNKQFISILNHYVIAIDVYFDGLKSIINNLDGIILSNPSKYRDIIVYIKSFERKLNNNVGKFTNDPDGRTTYIKLFLITVSEVMIQLKDWVLNSVLDSDDPLYKLVHSTDYTMLLNYANVKSRDIDAAIVPYSENIEKESYNDSINNKIVILEDRVFNIIKDFKIFLEDYKLSRDENFDEQRRLFEERANDALINYQNSLDEIKKQYQNDLIPQVSDLKSKLSNNKAELESLLGDVELYQDKMTNKAVSEMSAHYYKKSKFERNSYFIITIISALIIIFSVKSAYNGVNNYYAQYVSTEFCDKRSENTDIIPPLKLQSYEECMKDLTVKREATQKYAFNYLIFRLSFSLLLFLAVIYASRIAMRAYNHWRQSENMYLKLNTLSPFIGSLEKPVRNDVHLSLVPDYFGKDAGIVENSKDATKDIPNNISNVAIKLIEQAGSTIGSKLGSDKESKSSDSESSTEKNTKKSGDETK